MSQSRSDLLSALSPTFVPGPNTVLCARGRKAKNHSGNKWIRSLVHLHRKAYSECPVKLERSFLVAKIVRTIREANPEGAFVRNVKGIWYDVGDRNAREKIGQMFRDELHDEFKSSTRAKALRRRRRDTNSGAEEEEEDRSDTTCTTTVNSCVVDDASNDPNKALQKTVKAKNNRREQDRCLTSSPFPVKQVSFHPVTPLPSDADEDKTLIKNVDIDTSFQDLEPLPLNEALIFPHTFDFNLSATTIETRASEVRSFEEAMEQLYQSSFPIL